MLFYLPTLFIYCYDYQENFYGYISQKEYLNAVELYFFIINIFIAAFILFRLILGKIFIHKIIVFEKSQTHWPLYFRFWLVISVFFLFLYLMNGVVQNPF